MSKLQEALEKLREIRQTEYLDGEGNADAATRTTNNHAVAPRVRDHASNALYPDDPNASEFAEFADSATEFKTATTISVDPASLIEMGIEAPPHDAEKIAQEFRRIKRPLMNTTFGVRQLLGDNANVIMVSSAMPGSGKTFCSYNLAKSIAQERDVGALLVDADVLKPNISRCFGLESHVGLIDYLLDESIELADILVSTDLSDIIVLPAGSQHPDATELLASKRMQQLVSTLSQQFSDRAVIFDTPPLLLTNESHVLADHVGQIILIVETGVSSHESVRHALEMLNRSKPINVVLNKAKSGFGSAAAGGYGYYGYGRGGA